ncbi:zinc-binding alcohol dehydrogenase family protein [Thermopolyspora sp. NPDC052614]|uniref:quinone oxidoreductase family protein n=1 Tax=Thermopolyspora sp. NPDC052614 TaxID=3155682 RepID=UPI00342FB909
MRAAVITAPNHPPVYGTYPDPVGDGPDAMVVDVLAAGLHHLTRGMASGAHYASNGAYPLVPGVDGVVRDPEGNLRYVALDNSTFGTFAERTVIDPRRSVVLPSDVDPVTIAAAMNPAMSSWLALRRRVDFRPGQRVLIIGATGSAGRMAIQIAKLLGAAEVIAVGREQDRLKPLIELGADKTATFDEVSCAADVDVVLDYVWGEPSAKAMMAMLTARADRSVPLTWVEIGGMAGQTAPIHGAALRAARFQIVGSGFGSVSPREIIAELPTVARAINDGAIEVRARALPLSAISHAWHAETEDRIVLVP